MRPGRLLAPLALTGILMSADTLPAAAPPAAAPPAAPEKAVDLVKMTVTGELEGKPFSEKRLTIEVGSTGSISMPVDPAGVSWRVAITPAERTAEYVRLALEVERATGDTKTVVARPKLTVLKGKSGVVTARDDHGGLKLDLRVDW